MVAALLAAPVGAQIGRGQAVCGRRPPHEILPPGDPLMTIAELYQAIEQERRKAIVGQDATFELLVVALLAGGHVLLEGVPGIAKTLMARTLAATVSGSFKRVQFTPDLM